MLHMGVLSPLKMIEILFFGILPPNRGEASSGSTTKPYGGCGYVPDDSSSFDNHGSTLSSISHIRRFTLSLLTPLIPSQSLGINDATICKDQKQNKIAFKTSKLNETISKGKE